MPKARTKNRKVYPLDISALDSQLSKASEKTGIKSKAQLMKLAIARGLPVLMAQLGRRAA